ncbi:MAG: alpha/beta hydrolase [Bacteroidota bacterium]
MRNTHIIYLILLSLLGGGCVSRHKNIVYDNQHDLKLDVYSPKKRDNPKPVLVFIHGGNWVRGKKSIYKFFGKGFAKKDVVTVIINYRLSPNATYDSLALNAATAVKWVKDNVKKYNGDTNNIFVSGHSAGAHLAALIDTDDTYFDKLNIKNPVRGTILIDAFGLDMFSYLSNSTNPKDSVYYPIFSRNSETWKKGSPAFHLKRNMPPFLLFLGTNTYPAITKGTVDFLKVLQPYQPGTPLVIVNRKGHIGMIFQFLNKKNKAYKQITDFIDKESKKE